jgi:hypothetical protein
MLVAVAAEAMLRHVSEPRNIERRQIPQEEPVEAGQEEDRGEMSEERGKKKDKKNLKRIKREKRKARKSAKKAKNF